MRARARTRRRGRRSQPLGRPGAGAVAGGGVARGLGALGGAIARGRVVLQAPFSWSRKKRQHHQSSSSRNSSSTSHCLHHCHSSSSHRSSNSSKDSSPYQTHRGNTGGASSNDSGRGGSSSRKRILRLRERACRQSSTRTARRPRRERRGWRLHLRPLREWPTTPERQGLDRLQARRRHRRQRHLQHQGTVGCPPRRLQPHQSQRKRRQPRRLDRSSSLAAALATTRGQVSRGPPATLARRELGRPQAPAPLLPRRRPGPQPPSMARGCASCAYRRCCCRRRAPALLQSPRPSRSRPRRLARASRWRLMLWGSQRRSATRCWPPWRPRRRGRRRRCLRCSWGCGTGACGAPACKETPGWSSGG